MLGTENPSEPMIKHVDAKLLEEHVRSMGGEFMAGRAELAPQAAQWVEDGDDHGDNVKLVYDDYIVNSQNQIC